MSQLLKEHPHKLELMFKIRLDDPNGKYVHWEKLKHLNLTSDLSGKEYWAALKMARRQARRDVPLFQKNANPFWYCEPSELAELLHYVDQHAAGNIETKEVVFSDSDKNRYLSRSIVEEPFSSSVLEGAATTRAIAKKLIEETRQPRTRDELMVFNNYQALRFVKEHINTDLTPDLILDLHKIVTHRTLDEPEMEGRLRRPSDNVDVVAEDTGEILHIPPPYEELAERLVRYCDFANDVTATDRFMHPVIRAVILHFMMGYNHPFFDGNGRTARALFYWYVLRHGYWILEYVSISKVLREAPGQYGRAYLETESDEGDLTYFLINQLQTLSKAIHQLHVYLDSRSKQLSDFERAISDGDFNYRQSYLLNELVRNRVRTMKISEHAAQHKVTYVTARNDLEDLVSRHLMSKSKQGRESVYRARANLIRRLRIED